MSTVCVCSRLLCIEVFDITYIVDSGSNTSGGSCGLQSLEENDENQENIKRPVKSE